jgi:hypothetical protein
VQTDIVDFRQLDIDITACAGNRYGQSCLLVHWKGEVAERGVNGNLGGGGQGPWTKGAQGKDGQEN